MDPWAEADWLDRFRSLSAGRTAILITHRLTTAMRADVIHVMADGQIVESGSHEATAQARQAIRAVVGSANGVPTGVSGEATLLLACARRFVAGQSDDEVHAALCSDLDWPTLLELADAHSVMPLLYSALEQECPVRVTQNLRTSFANHARSNLAHTAELLKVLAILEQNRIPVIALKGPVLAAWGYGDLALRAFSDLDLLIRPDHVARAKDLLVAVDTGCAQTCTGPRKAPCGGRKMANSCSSAQTAGSRWTCIGSFSRNIFRNR